MSQRALLELLRGKGAHADPLACVEDLSPELAARMIAGFPHSIGQLVFHMNFWMNYDLRRICGERPPYPAHNAESFPPPPSPADAADWDRLCRDFAWFLGEHARLAESPEGELDREIEPLHGNHKRVAGAVGAILWQTVSHNSYHLGQVAMIRRAMGAWPPRGGGDSW